MKSLEELAKDVDRIGLSKDTDLFYQVMGDLFGMMNFSLSKDWMGVNIKLPLGDSEIGRGVFATYKKESIDILNSFVKDLNVSIDGYMRTQEFVRDRCFFNILTYYQNFSDFKKGIYLYNSICSNSAHDFSKQILDLNESSKMHPEMSKTLFKVWALNTHGVVKDGEGYLFSPKAVFELASSYPTTYYFNVEVKK